VPLSLKPLTIVAQELLAHRWSHGEALAGRPCAVRRHPAVPGRRTCTSMVHVSLDHRVQAEHTRILLRKMGMLIPCAARHGSDANESAELHCASGHTLESCRTCARGGRLFRAGPRELNVRPRWPWTSGLLPTAFSALAFCLLLQPTGQVVDDSLAAPVTGRWNGDPRAGYQADTHDSSFPTLPPRPLSTTERSSRRHVLVRRRTDLESRHADT
jgi:hypothetical protein